MIYLDTNVVIGATNKRPEAVAARFDAKLANGSSLHISTIVLFELRFGLAKSQRRTVSKLILERALVPLTIVPFDADDAAVAAEIRAALDAAGTPIGPYDVLIAGQALRHRATLVTANTREFARVPGLKVEDWGVG